MFDLGPGVALRSSEGYERGITGLAMSGITQAFLTHHHSDHTLGLPAVHLDPRFLVGGRVESPTAEAIPRIWLLTIEVNARGKQAIRSLPHAASIHGLSDESEHLPTTHVPPGPKGRGDAHRLCRCAGGTVPPAGDAHHNGPEPQRA
ncbi:MAG: hypothetical protein ABFS21_12255, partial [Actinomycetota bacterium]